MSRTITLHSIGDELQAQVNGKLTTISLEELIHETITYNANIYFLGLPQNAQFICKLLELLITSDIVDSRPFNAHVATPCNHCQVNRIYTPQEAFGFIEKTFGIPSSSGGFRRLSVHADWPVYTMLLKTVQETIANKLYLLHPAWTALSFVDTLHLPSAISFLNSIVDPRWFVDAMYPDRSSKINRYLGLSARMMRTIWMDTHSNNVMQHSTDEKGQMRSRAEQLVYSWTGGGRYIKIYPENLSSPRNFLFRYFLKCAVNFDKFMALLRASKKFLSFVRQVWLNEVALTHSGHLFVPKYFFEDALDVEGWYINLRNHYNK